MSGETDIGNIRLGPGRCPRCTGFHPGDCAAIDALASPAAKGEDHSPDAGNMVEPPASDEAVERAAEASMTPPGEEMKLVAELRAVDPLDEHDLWENGALLRKAADLIEQLVGDRDRAVEDLDDLRSDAATTARTVFNELSAMGHSCGNSMRALSTARAFLDSLDQSKGQSER